jgi:hypothetical protein
MLDLTNHVLVRLAAHRVGETKFKSYLVLGDDVVIQGREVAESYVALLTELGVKVRLSKSVEPSMEIGLEFASKLINKDGDLRPYPVGLILEGRLVSKFQFLSSWVESWCNQANSEGPDLEVVASTLFGAKKWQHLLGVWGMYEFLSQ